MSVIAARVYKQAIVIVSDSILLKDDLKRTTSFKKLQKINGNIIGGSGVVEEVYLMFDFVKADHWPEAASEAAVLRFVRQFSSYKEEVTGTNTIDGCYLLVVNKHLYEVDGFFVQEVTDYTAIGSGESYAITALHLGHTPEEAVEVTCELCCSTGGPLIMYDVYTGD